MIIKSKNETLDQNKVKQKQVSTCSSGVILLAQVLQPTQLFTNLEYTLQLGSRVDTAYPSKEFSK